MQTTLEILQEKFPNENTIFAFHIGRGGHFWNQGHLSYLGVRNIGDFTEDLTTTFENQSILSNRFGWDYTGDTEQECILDLISGKKFFDLAEKFGITEEMLGEEIYVNGCGHHVGLTVAQCKVGIGCINLDNDYDTTYTKLLSDCDENELELILNSNC